MRYCLVLDVLEKKPHRRVVREGAILRIETEMRGMKVEDD